MTNTSINLDYFDVTAAVNAMGPPAILQTQLTQHSPAFAGPTVTPAPGSSVPHLTPITSHRTPNSSQTRTYKMAVDEALASRRRVDEFQQKLAASRTEAVNGGEMAVGADGKTYVTEKVKVETVATWVKDLQDRKRAGEGEKKD